MQHLEKRYFSDFWTDLIVYIIFRYHGAIPSTNAVRIMNPSE